MQEAVNAADVQQREIGSADGQPGHHVTGRSSQLSNELGRVASPVQMVRVGRNDPVNVRLDWGLYTVLPRRN